MDEELQEIIRQCREEQQEEENLWPWYRRIPYQFVCYKLAEAEIIPEKVRIKMSNAASVLFDPVWKKPKLKKVK